MLPRGKEIMSSNASMTLRRQANETAAKHAAGDGGNGAARAALPSQGGPEQAPSGFLEVEILKGREALHSLGEEWKILTRCADPSLFSPFQDRAWLSAWVEAGERHARAAGDGEKARGTGSAMPVVAVAREAGEPVLLMPLQADRHGGLRRLTWLSVPALQYGGMLIDARLSEARKAEVLLATLAGLQDEAEGRDFLDFRLLPADGGSVSALLSRPRRESVNHAFRVNMAAHADWRSYELSLKRSTRRARHKRLNRLARQGTLEFRVHEHGSRRHELLDIALGWKRAWLASRGEAGTLAASPLFADFMHELLERAEDAACRWVAAEIRLDGRVLAVEINAIMQGVMHAYLSAYDMDEAGHSPGKVLMWLLLKWCKENGIDIYDMLANASRYKEEWANERRALLHPVLPLTLRGRAYALWASRVRGRARQAYHALPQPLKGIIGASLRRLRGGGG
jgi:CelD/BcsL family acetyltransferase involved in cellulose biosynthesis